MSDETHLHRQSEIVSVCAEYESLIRQNKSPRIDEFVLRVDESVRPALVYKLIEIEVAVRSSRGESVSKEALLEQYSHFLASSSSEPWLEETVDNREMPTPMGYSVGGPTKLFAGQQYAAFEPPAIEGVTIVRVLGRGGMGVVYEAIQEDLNRRVALKTILDRANDVPEFLDRFRREAKSIAELNDPHFLQIYQFGNTASGPYMALEYVDGGSLEEYRQGEPQPPEFAATTLEVISRAMHKAHEIGLVHRDLKPHNILLTSHGVPKIADFGLVKRHDGDIDETEYGRVMGTACYMAPEQTIDSSSVGPTADVHALGAMLYCLLTGRPPFLATTRADTMLQVRNDEPVPPSRLQPTVPRDLETICLKCLEKDPQKRFNSALALAEDLRRFQNHEPITARRVSYAERGWRWCRRNPRVAIPSACAALLAIVLAVAGPVAAVLIDKARQEAVRSAQVAEEARQDAVHSAEVAVDALGSLARDSQDVLQKIPGEAGVRLREGFLNDAIDGLGELADKSSDPVILATALRRRGDIHLEAGQPKLALEDYQRCLEAVQQRHNRFKSRPWNQQRNVARAKDSIGDAHLADNRTDLALAAYQAAFDIRQRQLNNYPSKEMTEEDIATSHGKLSSVYRRMGELDKALEDAQASLKLRQQFHRNHPDEAIVARELGGAFREVGIIQKRLGNRPQARECLQQSLPILERVWKQWEEQPGYQGEYKLDANIGLTQTDLAETYLFDGNHELAREQYDHAVQRLMPIYKENRGNSTIKQTYWRTLYGKGTCELEVDEAEAKRYFGAAAEISTNRTTQMLSRARLGDTAGAADRAGTLAGRDDKMSLYYAGCGFALCAWSAERQADLSDDERAKQSREFARQALDALERAIGKGFDNAAELRDNPELDALREDVRFQELLDRVDP